eukprot:6483129-Amphidinium_carterae.1
MQRRAAKPCIVSWQIECAICNIDARVLCSQNIVRRIMASTPSYEWREWGGRWWRRPWTSAGDPSTRWEEAVKWGEHPPVQIGGARLRQPRPTGRTRIRAVCVNYFRGRLRHLKKCMNEHGCGQPGTPAFDIVAWTARFADYKGYLENHNAKTLTLTEAQVVLVGKAIIAHFLAQEADATDSVTFAPLVLKQQN